MSWRERRQEREKTKAYDAQHARAMSEKEAERVASDKEAPADNRSAEDQEEPP